MLIDSLVLTAFAGPVPERQACSLEQACPVAGSHLTTYSPLTAWPVYEWQTVFVNTGNAEQRFGLSLDASDDRLVEEIALPPGEEADLSYWAEGRLGKPRVTPVPAPEELSWKTRKLPRGTAGKVCVSNARGGEPQTFVVRGVDARGVERDSEPVTADAMSSLCVPFHIAGKPPRAMAIDVVYVGPPDPIPKAPSGSHAALLDGEGVARFPELGMEVQVHETGPVPGATRKAGAMPLAWRATATCGGRTFDGEDSAPGNRYVLCGYMMGVYEVAGGTEVSLFSL